MHVPRALLDPDSRWYEKLDAGTWPDEACRDPYVVADPEGDGWHMLVTARAPGGPAGGRGVIGHARSADLRTGEIGPPLTAPSGFGHIEVPRVATIDGRHVLMFSCRPDRLDDARRARWTGGWALGRAGDVNARGYVVGFRDTEDGLPRRDRGPDPARGPRGDGPDRRVIRRSSLTV